MWLISWDGLIFELDDRFQCLCVCMWKSEREQKRKQYLVQSLINWHTQKWILFIAYNLFDVFIHTFENLCENVWVVIYISRQFFFFCGCIYFCDYTCMWVFYPCFRIILNATLILLSESLPKMSFIPHYWTKDIRFIFFHNVMKTEHL